MYSRPLFAVQTDGQLLAYLPLNSVLVVLTGVVTACCMCCCPAGRTRITLRSTGELYSHVPPSAKVHNLVLGKTWIDSFGPFLVSSVNTGVRVEMEFKACGWFGSNQYEFEGLVLDEQVGVWAQCCGFALLHLCISCTAHGQCTMVLSGRHQSLLSIV